MRNLEVDHIIAETNGGTDHIENLQLLCGHCNRIKGDRGQVISHIKTEQRLKCKTCKKDVLLQECLSVVFERITTT